MQAAVLEYWAASGYVEVCGTGHSAAAVLQAIPTSPPNWEEETVTLQPAAETSLATAVYIS